MCNKNTYVLNTAIRIKNKSNEQQMRRNSFVQFHVFVACLSNPIYTTEKKWTRNHRKGTSINVKLKNERTVNCYRTRHLHGFSKFLSHPHYLCTFVFGHPKKVCKLRNFFVAGKSRRPVRRHFTAHFDRDNVATRQISLQNMYSKLVEMAEVS